MAYPMNYYDFTREEWRRFAREQVVPLTPESLRQIKAFNDRISMQDVRDIYMPLVRLIQAEAAAYHERQVKKSTFLHKPIRHTPFIIGIAGSVAVGKSTTARVLEMLMTHLFSDRHIQLITTDGFLYPNAELKERGIMNRKGFPESYDMGALIRFLNDVKSGKQVIRAPKYSHATYDILPHEYEEITDPDVLIVEGINTLQLPSTEQIYISDFTDFSIYVDAESNLIEKWFLDRFAALLDTAFQDPTNYYHSTALGDRQEAMKMAEKVWQEIDLKNLTEYILPTRNRADLIIHKTEGHLVDHVLFRKY
ncbi:type I pantothenate kinase [Levilactobacillus bambusae]|uniref:Pantothenate kinase n=1 Tax=Levilactobacillus bambusae TaxID=2024736 RepID=A0A2V1MYI2_9LACO|nr:type I pantothenate kinase [Levilactobacillus bambusae]PWG00029.1 type I pantothenate kinase [Levilactobacillus bambusae]